MRSGPNLTNEARLSYSTDDLGWNRPHPEIPTLTTKIHMLSTGVAAIRRYFAWQPASTATRTSTTVGKLLDNVIWTRGQHLVTIGGGVAAARSSDGYLTAGQGGQYMFQQHPFVRASGTPSYLEAAIDRTALPIIQQPDFNRTYKYGQDFLFAQDTYKLTPRLTVNYGVRYEFYGGPQNTGAAKDALIQLGSGAGWRKQLVGASLVLPSSSGDQQLFRSSKRLRGPRWALPTICSAPGAPCCAAASARSTIGPSTISGRMSATTISFCRCSRLPAVRRIFWRPSPHDPADVSRPEAWPARFRT